MLHLNNVLHIALLAVSGAIVLSVILMGLKNPKLFRHSNTGRVLTIFSLVLSLASGVIYVLASTKPAANFECVMSGSTAPVKLDCLISGGDGSKVVWQVSKSDGNSVVSSSPRLEAKLDDPGLYNVSVDVENRNWLIRQSNSSSQIFHVEPQSSVQSSYQRVFHAQIASGSNIVRPLIFGVDPDERIIAAHVQVSDPTLSQARILGRTDQEVYVQVDTKADYKETPFSIRPVSRVLLIQVFVEVTKVPPR